MDFFAIVSKSEFTNKNMNTHAISANGQPVDPATGDTPIVVYKRKIILTDAQIKLLPTTHMVLVEAPGEGKILVFHGAVFHKPVWSSGLGYDGIVDYDILQIGYPTGNSVNTGFLKSPDGVFPFDDISSLLNDSVLQVKVFQDMPKGGGSLARPVPLVFGGSFNNTNNPLVVKASTDVITPFTGGHPNNTLEITVFYSVVDL